jgi:anti-anti-sigma regulatory factor
MTAEMKLATRLDSGAAAALAAELSVHRGTPLRIDASDTELLGTLAQQALASAAVAWRASGHDFLISGVTPRVRAQIEILGLDGVLLPDAEDTA